MSNELAASKPMSAAIEQVLIGGDLAKLDPGQRVEYYGKLCQSLGLNPLTKPFAYITLNGKLQLYALKDCTEQLRCLHGVSILAVEGKVVEDLYIVTARGTESKGRSDASTGAVSIAGLKGEAKANAIMKAETKAKRRLTLSICGLGMLDESEADSIPGAQRHDVTTITNQTQLEAAPRGRAAVVQPTAQHQEVEPELPELDPADHYPRDAGPDLGPEQHADIPRDDPEPPAFSTDAKPFVFEKVRILKVIAASGKGPIKLEVEGQARKLDLWPKDEALVKAFKAMWNPPRNIKHYMIEGLEEPNVNPKYGPNFRVMRIEATP